MASTDNPAQIRSTSFERRNAMGVPVLVMGASGSGKSASLRNFKPTEISVFNVAGKPLPFRGKLPMMVTSDYRQITSKMSLSPKRAIAIDDAQYLMGFEEMDSKKTGYDKFNSIGFNFVGLVRFVATQLPPDTIVYFLQHTEVGDDGRVKAKTLGKLIDNHYTLEGLFSVVLMVEADKNKHYFVTNSDGTNTCKSPMGMFDQQEIDNDLKMVDGIIREYWELLPVTGEREDGKKDKEGENA